MAETKKLPAPKKPSWIFSKGLLGDSKWRTPLIIALFFFLAIIIWSSGLSNLPFFDTSTKAPADGSIAIKVDGFGFTPFDIMFISGRGLDVDAATSIIFTTSQGEVLTIPALRVTTDMVVVPVPPIAYDKTVGAFAPDQTSLRVVQVKKVDDKMIVKTSNQSSFFEIYPPSVPSAFTKDDAVKIPKGAISQLVIAVSVESLKSAAGKVPAENKALKASIEKNRKGMEKILVAVDKIIKNPKTTVKLPVSNGTTISLGASDLVWLDAFYSGYLGMLEKVELARNNEKTNVFISVAKAKSANACVIALLSNDLRIKQLDSIAIQFCNTIEPEVGAVVKTPDDKSFNFEYLLQTPLILALGLPEGAVKWNAEVAGWSLSKQLGIGTALSMGFSFAYERKLPDWWSLGSVLATAYAAKYNPMLAQIQFATDMWDNLCAVVPKSLGCMDTRSIILSSGQILTDLAKNQENFLYLANAMVGGKLTTLVDELYIPENAVRVEFDKIGIDKGGYSNVGGEPVTQTKPVPKTTTAPKPIPASSPAPTSPDPVKSKATCAAGYITCGQGCILSSSTCCPSGTIGCPAGSTCTSDNTCARVCKAGYEVCGKGCMIAGEICCPSGTISCPAGSTCTSDNRCALSVKSIASGCAVGYEVCGDSCMIAGRTCCPGTSFSCPGGNTCTPDNKCLSPENYAYGEPCAGGLYGTNGQCIICTSGDAYSTAINSSCSPAKDGIYCCGGTGGCLQNLATMDQSNMTPEQLREAASCGFDF